MPPMSSLLTSVYPQSNAVPMKDMQNEGIGYIHISQDTSKSTYTIMAFLVNFCHSGAFDSILDNKVQKARKRMVLICPFLSE
jgi:hypothetical protein